MQTETLIVDAQQPQAAVIARAADVLRRGGLVAFPTETVYGLGANALAPAAAAKIFAAKGRPARNPLIVHVATVAAARQLVTAWPETAEKLAARFWPGPITFVLPKQTLVPDAVTAGSPTVAIRVPAHPVTQALLRATDLPIAAPSANRSNRLSPTLAQHVQRDLAGRIDLILDGGPTSGGLESTVIDLTTAQPRLLRPGLVSPAEIETVVGPIIRGADHADNRIEIHEATADNQQPLASPGMLSRHYSPRTPLECLPAETVWPRVLQLCEQGEKVGWLTFSPHESHHHPQLVTKKMPDDAASYAAQLFATLHALDEKELDCIIVTLPPVADEWLAVHDRLRRASTRE